MPSWGGDRIGCGWRQRKVVDSERLQYMHDLNG